MATNWNAVLANINNASDILAILRKVLGLLDGKVDLTRIDEIIQDITNMGTDVKSALENVNAALTDFDSESQEAIQQVIAAGLMEGFTTEAELLASRPTVAKKYAKAEDTDVVWFWNKPEGSPDGSYWISTGLSELDQSISYTKENIQLISNSASLIAATDVLPTFGYENAGASEAAVDATYIFPNPTTTDTILKRLKFTSGKANAELKVKVFKKSGANFIFDRELITLNTQMGLNVIELDPVLHLNASEYIAVSILTPDALKYLSTNQQYNLYYSGGAYATSIPDSAFGRTAYVQFSAYTKTEIDKIPDAINLLDSKAAKSARLGCQVVEGSTVAASAAHWIPDQVCSISGAIRKFTTYATASGKLQVGVYGKNGSVFTRKRFVEVDIAVGLNNIAINLDIEVGEYAGIRALAAGLTTYLSNNKNAFSIWSGNKDVNEQTFSGPTPNYAWQFNFDVIERKLDKKKWQDKNVVTFGDSITYYDGRQFGGGHLESGQLVVGYQSYMRDVLGCNIDNQGRSGWDMTEILNVVNSYDFTNVYAVTLTSGANDHRKDIQVYPSGDTPETTETAPRPIGSTFDTTTFAGAMQSAIEKIINSNKDIKIFLITPIRGWYYESGTSDVPGPYKGEQLLSVEYVNAIKSIGELYSLPVIDWYNEVGFNDLNKYYYLGDNPQTVKAYLLHPNLKGYKKMGGMVTGKLIQY
ncbi:SGNH/GDSL hydrolase family protein [Acinetobacter pittii]